MALIFALAASLFVCMTPTQQAAAEGRTFTVGFDAEFPPYGYKDDKGEYVGFDLDLAQEVCDRLGWTLKKQPIIWDNKDMELQSGSIDCIWNGFTINGREDKYTWSTPYVDNSQVVIVKSDSAIQKLSDLAGKTVVVQADSSALAAFQGDDATDENKALAKSFKALQQTADYNSSFLELESGMADAICMDIGVANYQLSSRGNAFRMLEEQVSSEAYGIGFKLGNTELRDQVQNVLYAMKQDGKFDEIAKKWGLTDSVCLVVPQKGDVETGRTFTVGFDAEFPPYGYKDDKGEYVGFDLDLAQEVCDRLGWTLKKQPIIWDNKDMELQSGSIDCIWNGFTINGREDKYTWSTPYVDNSQVVIVKSDSAIQKLSDLAGKTVVVQADSSALAAFQGDDATDENKALAKSFKALQQTADYNSSFLELESGMADAICMDIGVANYQLKSRPDGFRILEERVSTEKYGIGFKLGNKELRDQVQKTLLEMKADGTFDKIASKWNLLDSVCLSADDKFIDQKEQAPVLPGQEKSGIDWGFMLGELGQGMLKTLAVFFLTLLFSLPLGLLLAFVRMSRFKILQWIAKIYISIMRGTPLMLQLIVVCFAPYYVFGISLSENYRFTAVIIGFSINYAAYFAEIFRAGIKAVPNGQREAASVLGYSRSQTFGKIVFPQMVKNVLPPVTNEIITLVKDTSLASVLTYLEMFTIAKQIAATYSNLIPLFVAGVFYYVFNFVVAFVMSLIEKKLNYYR